MLKGLDNEKIDLNEKKVSISDILRRKVKKGKFLKNTQRCWVKL